MLFDRWKGVGAGIGGRFLHEGTNGNKGRGGIYSGGSTKQKAFPRMETPSKLIYCLLRFGGGFCLGFEGVSSQFYEFAEGARISGGDVRENFAVEFYFGGFQTFHKAAVGHASGAGRSVDTNLPESAVVALFGLAIAKCILASVIQSVGCVTVQFGTAHPKAFGGFNRADTAFT
jgi:hypothetical protein